MLQRVASLGAALALVVFVGTALADKEKSNSNSPIKGVVTKAGDGSITVTDKAGKDRKLTVDKDADITCDGKECKLDDLKKGVSVTVTMKKDGDNQVASKIEAKTDNDKDK